ncbi:MAG: pyridoxamine 5'-phosphate oxidase family protein [Gammaproteobacteria bacterium]|nr:pyridoxamine 5'-phosphate oxidase family protein [Gammaproteobacteria bacterium]
MTTMYHDRNRALQDRFDSRRLADRIEQRLVRDRITADDQAFIESLDMFFLATADASGQPSCSYKGGDPGFVRVVDEQQLAFPSYDGNGMFLSAGNVQVNPHVGLLFIDFERPKRLRVHGIASIEHDDLLRREFVEAQFIVRIRVQQVFPNCPRYIHQYQRGERSIYVPRPTCATPVPGWKRADWAADVLPDPGKDTERK